MTPDTGAIKTDVGGSISGNRVTALQNRAVSNQAPLDGQALVWNGTTEVWQPAALPVAAGAVAVKNQGVTVGSRPVQNFLPGFGLLQILSDTGTEIQIQPSIDSAIVQTRTNAQSGESLRCVSAGTVGTDYNCQLQPTLSSYPNGVFFYWQPDVAASGSITLNIDDLGPKAVTLPDGVSLPLPGDIVASAVYPLWYDGIRFRLLTAQATPRSAAVRPSCAVGSRGWFWHQPAAAGSADTAAVCTKDAGDLYAWRALY